MPTPFIPSANPAVNDQIVVNDGWYPDLDAADFKRQTGLGDVFASARIAAELQAAMIHVNAGIADWRAGQTAAALSGVPAPLYGTVSEKVVLYTAAVFARARAVLLRDTRDYDSTKDGHDRADALEKTADGYLQKSAEAVARLTGRTRMTVELI